ncbi:MAG TPA: CsgG/HfaB family protein [Polyangia bacterium]|nr:CsgG/HfaB family protein [Polyangia bacterium]
MRALAVALALAASTARAAPVVAVMPFRDLSGGRGAVGEAIRETVTSDLRQVAGVRVVERGAIDQVLGELRLQASPEVDAPTAARIGKLVGATLMAIGAYQRAGASVRLTARFVNVETGEIVGSAKVDGAAGELLSLQDRVTAELARSAGFAFTGRRRPRLRSLRAVENYGDALVERDDTRRHELLRAAIAEEPEYDYPLRDLDALERRMQDYVARAEQERQRLGLARVDELAARARAAGDPEKRERAYEALLDELHAQLRFRRLTEEARALVEHPPLDRATPPGARLDERARFELILGLCIFKNDPDRVLREGERFLAAHPASPRFDDVKRFMDYAIRWKRKADAGPREAESRIRALPAERRGDPCTVARIYHEARQLREAAAQYERCVADPRADQNALANLINTYIAIPDFKSARRALALMRARFPGAAEGPMGQGWRELPIDAD